MAKVVEKANSQDMNAAGGPPVGGLDHEDSPQKYNRRAAFFAALIVIVLAAVWFGTKFFIWSASHVSTDDATVASDVVEIAPQVSGTVTKLYVDDNQHVNKGTLLVQLDPSTFETAVSQAKANLDLAIAEAQAASATVKLTQGQTSAQVVQAQAVMGQSAGGIESSIADISKAQASVSQARAQVSTATAGVYGAQSAVAIAKANRLKAYDAVSDAQAQLNTAKAAVNTALANVDAAVATAVNADKQATRNETLFRQGAVSGQVAEGYRAASDVAKAGVAAARQNLEQAKSVVLQREADVKSAQSQTPAADAAVAQSNSQLDAAKDQVDAARDTVNEYQAQVASASASETQARARKTQSFGQFTQATVGRTSVAVTQAQEKETDAKVEQARAALQDAEINLARTKIYAPVAGRISKNTVEVGNLVQPGGVITAIVPDEDMWVVANFKETQLDNLRVGQPVEIDVDALPKHPFKGRVDSISAGTGSTFALLPPDNATGNFTKVVQRVSVKIKFNHGQEGVENLRSGMSVSATVTTRGD